MTTLPLRDSWSFRPVLPSVFPSVPFVILMHPLTHVFLAPEFTHPLELFCSLLSQFVHSFFPQFPGSHLKNSAFHSLPHVNDGSDLVYHFLCGPDPCTDFAHESRRRLLAHGFLYKPRFPPLSCRLRIIDLFALLLQASILVSNPTAFYTFWSCASSLMCLTTAKFCGCLHIQIYFNHQQLVFGDRMLL